MYSDKLVSPGPLEEGRYLNLTLYNPERDKRIGKKEGRELERGKNEFLSKKKAFVAVILGTEKSDKLPRCPISECAISIHNRRSLD